MKRQILDAIDHKPTAAPSLTAHASGLTCFRLEFDDTATAWLTFDTPNSPVNVWNEATLRELGLCLDIITRGHEARALIIRSAKEKVCIAGADLKALRSLSIRRLETLITLGQGTFNRLAALEIPTIALIHGACVGGGLEMALACDVRIASDSDVTRLGLPETQLGLIPAWGGSTRLPRLLGLPAALGCIVTGKLLKPQQARRLGLVDSVVGREYLEGEARRRLAAGIETPGLSFRRRMWSWPGLRQIVAYKARRQVLNKTRGLYQAPLRAIDVATRAAVAPLPKAMELERHAILHLALTQDTERLIDLFFRNEEASKKPYSRGVALPVHDVAVIGAGVMGSGIAHWVASKGNRVLMQDINTEALARGLGRIHGLLAEGRKRRSIGSREMRDTMDRVTLEHRSVPLTHYPLVIEAATEDMSLKAKIFAGLAGRCGPDTILATNTSALSVSELATVVPHPERVVGLHFFNPVHRMPLVEVITTPHTSEDIIATAVTFVQRLGKTPVVVKDSPGFVVNRILMPYLMEAVRLYDTGIPATLIDEAMLDFGMPMGPLRLLDEVGLDVAAHVGETLAAAFPTRMQRSDTLERLVAAGKLGCKSGEGFYAYPRRRKPVKHVDHALMDQVQHRLALLLGNEAAHCAAEGIVRTPSDIDLAMILGTGYPAFRGGPLTWIHDLGLDNAATELRMLAAMTPAPNPFAPVELQEGSTVP